MNELDYYREHLRQWFPGTPEERLTEAAEFMITAMEGVERKPRLGPEDFAAAKEDAKVLARILSPETQEP